MVAAPKVNVGTTADPIVTRLADEDKVPWYKKRNLRLMYLWLFCCCMGVEMTSGFDSQLINTLQFSSAFHKYFSGGRLDDKDNFAIEPGMLGFINSCYQLGSIFAVPIAPWFAHRFGRRWSIMLGSWIMVVGALIQGFAQHVAMYIIARMLLGVGILFAIISGAALIGELSHPKERAILTSLFNSSYFIGQIISSGIATRTSTIESDVAWRLPSLLQICPSLLQIFTVFLLPESPAEIVQIRETIKAEMEVSKQSWFDLFRSPLSGNTLLSYYSNILFGMMGFTDVDTKTKINVSNSVWSLHDVRLHRHDHLLQRIQVALDDGKKNTSAGISALFWYFAFSPCYNIGNNALTYTYLVELWPYAQRSRGIGVQQIFGKLAGFFSTNVNSIALNKIAWKYLAIYCGWIFFDWLSDKEYNDRMASAVEKHINYDDTTAPPESKERQNV
ncbi:unnamed protein product [Parascedosporium putredinis]|uniref:Major facilitator superfamily (MFS) profile domain-containing protein n=1 Tax=Parascedosporium putredinis TaxID=1442378 RepID=A0A9P1H154_9PEZI|nr:unnamed protein product [Parascedosporium putredinis]CAI7992414.1 unnamed protein product [Parascedosporium putredinis]